MWHPAPGMIVEIKKIGRAKIIKLVGHNKALISVYTLNGRQIEWPVDKMLPVNPAPSQSVPSQSAPSQSVATQPTATSPHTETSSDIIQKYKDNDILKTRTIESLRFGLVPEHHIKELTLGFDEIKAWTCETFKQCLSGNPGGYEISGPYGTGKSHTLSIIRYLARKDGFLTADVEVDGQNISLSNPAVLLNALWVTLADDGLDTESPLVDLYVKAIKSGNTLTSIITPGNDKIKNNLRTIYTLMITDNMDKYANLVESVISCSAQITATQAVKEICSEHNLDRSKIRLAPMVSRIVDERGMDLVESLAGHAVLARLAGYKGLIITIDEFEIEHINNKNMERVRDSLYAINKYIAGDTRYYKAPLGIYIATIDQSGEIGDPIIHEYVAKDLKNRYRLKVWGKNERLELAERIHKMYSGTYNIKDGFDKKFASLVEELIARKIENNDSGLIRSFIKWYVGFLDIKYGPPGGKLNEGQY